MKPFLASTKRNTIGFAATAVSAGLLVLYPTSTHGGNGNRVPGRPVATPGVVVPTSTNSLARPSSIVVNGAAVDTPYGLVQVQLVVKAGHIIKAVAIDYPRASGRDRQINAHAVPALQTETLAAQNAQIDTISGATYTSEGYVSSLQSALDAAHLG